MRKRMVRIHLNGNDAPSLEGILVGWPWRNAGHYVIERARLVTAPDTATALEGRQYIPERTVLFLQEVS